MVWSYNRGMGLQRFPLSGFSGGWNLRDAPQALQPNEAQDLLNVTLADVIGALQQRAGKTRFDNTTPLTARVDNFQVWYPDTSGSLKYIFASVDGDIYRINASGVPSLLYNGTSGTIWDFEQATDVANNLYMWCMNGTDPPQKIDTAGAISAWGGSPPNGTILKLWRNRMAVSGVAANPQRVFFSDIGNPEAPVGDYSTNWVDIKGTEEDLVPITALESFSDDLYTFKVKSIWAITNGNSPWDNQRIATGLGTEGRFQTAILQSKMYFFNRQGVWSLTSDLRVTEESDPIKPLWSTRVNPTALTKARLIASPKNRILCALPLDNNAQNSHVLEFVPNLNFRKIGLRRSLTMPSICLHDYPVSAFCIFRPGAEDLLYGAESTSTKIHELFRGTSDDGVAINAYWLTGWRAIINEEPFERIRRVNLQMSGEVDVSVYRDYNEVAVHVQRLSTAADADPLWNGGIWDGGTWDPASGVALKTSRPDSRGRYHALRFGNSTKDTTFTIYAAELAIRGGKEHGPHSAE